MNAMGIRRIEPELRDWLRGRAAQHGVSVEEVRYLPRAAWQAAPDEKRRDDQARREAVFAQAVKLPPGTPSSATSRALTPPEAVVGASVAPKRVLEGPESVWVRTLPARAARPRRAGL